MTRKQFEDDTYLGDGVYISWDGYQLELSAQGNKIYLDPDTLDSLERYLLRYHRFLEDQKSYGETSRRESVQEQCDLFEGTGVDAGDESDL